MSYAKSLRNALKDRNEALFHGLEPLENAAKSVLIYTTSKFPYYTPHDFSHSQNVEEILNWLVPDEIKSKMNDHEIFFLLVAAWLHDWGMVASEEEKAEDVRRLHHIRTEENFEKLYDKVHLSLTESRIVGRICRGHREENLLNTEYDDSFFGSNILIRVRFLAALLRIADECDVTANRTPEIIYYSLKPEGASEEEFKKHLSITGIGKLAPYKLVLSGVAKTPKGVDVIEGVKKRIQSQLDSVKAILAANGVVLDLIEAHIDTRGFINKPIAFELDREAIVKLLIGTSLYSRKDVAVRELLQNAVDTCRFRKLIDNSFEPRIEVEFGREQISFEDNGVGMNFEDASQYFSKKGSSFYVSKDFKEILEGKKFDPISKFGIGVLSGFTIGKKMIVETKKENCAPCRFTITDLAEGWTYEEGSRQKPGTKITLFLNEEGKEIDFLNSLGHYAKNVSIPILVKKSETEEKQQFLQKWDYNIPEVLEEISKDVGERFFQSKPKLTLTINTSDLEATYHVFEAIYLRSHKNCFLLNHGIYVGNFELFPSTRPIWIALINIKSDIADLTVSREDFVKNKRFESFLDTVHDTLLNAIDHFIDQKQVHNPENLERCIELSTCLNDFFLDRFGAHREDIISRFLSKYYTKRIYPVFLKNGLAFLRGDEIVSRHFSKIIDYEIPLEFCKEHIETISQIFLSKINEKEAMVFDLEPHLQFIQPQRKFICGFCDILRSKGISALECWRVPDLVAKLEFNKENTPLDGLLPSASFFTHMPDYLRGITAQIQRFEFKPSLDNLVDSRSSFLDLYYKLVAIELFRAESEIAMNYEALLWREERNCELLSTGHFVYDMDDPFLRFIISKADHILRVEPMKKLIERYLKLLAIYYLSPTFRDRPPAEAHLITILEKTIAEMLNWSERYIPLGERVGKLAKVYNLET